MYLVSAENFPEAPTYPPPLVSVEKTSSSSSPSKNKKKKNKKKKRKREKHHPTKNGLNFLKR